MYIKEIWKPRQLDDIQERYVKEGLEVSIASISMQRPTRTVTLIQTAECPIFLVSKI